MLPGFLGQGRGTYLCEYCKRISPLMGFNHATCRSSLLYNIPWPWHLTNHLTVLFNSTVTAKHFVHTSLCGLTSMLDLREYWLSSCSLSNDLGGLLNCERSESSVTSEYSWRLRNSCNENVWPVSLPVPLPSGEYSTGKENQTCYRNGKIEYIYMGHSLISDFKSK